MFPLDISCAGFIIEAAIIIDRRPENGYNAIYWARGLPEGVPQGNDESM
jgi:hypothetical protein